MTKNYLYVILLLLSNLLAIGQKVTLTPTLVNGAGYSGGSINLGSVPTSTISLSVKVDIPSTAAVGDQGTIKIYFSKGTALGSNIATGGDGGALYFGGGKVATRSFIINLSWGDFLTSGGFIFAEYKSGTSYVSSNIAVIKNSTVNTGTNLNPPADAPNPNKIVNTLCCNQTIRLGEKPAPVTGSQYLNPYEDLPYGITRRITINNGYIDNYDDLNKILYLDHATELKDITINRQLGYVYGGELPNKSNTVTIKVVPSPILTNEISIDMPVSTNGFVEIINTNPKRISGTRQGGQVNLTILQDPFHTSQRGDSFTEIEKFEWEYTKTNVGTKNWITISGENNYFLESFNPSGISDTEDNYYLLRRIAIYKNIKRVSNTLKILLRTIRMNNTICCDQTLFISASNTIDSPSPIIGSDATSQTNQYFKYQWQSQSIDNNTSKLGNWTDIYGATSKDYLPSPLPLVSVYDTRTRGNIWTTLTTYNYRRRTSTQKYNGEESYSNEINLSAANYNYSTPNPLTVYPNPASSIINIKNSGTSFILANTPVAIVNMIGVVVVNQNSFSIIDSNLMSVDISNLPIGTYFVVVDLGGNRSNRTGFFKNN
jgi:hypothetical protein